MLRSLYAGVSGLRNSQIRLDVIGNNIANVNTIGFKSSRVTFKDMLSQTLQAATGSQAGRGGVNPMQVGLGVTVGSIDTNHTQGSRQTTGKTEDLSIEGNGFFVLRTGNNTVYTRAGAFDMDENGYLVVPGTGMKVQGWVNGQMQDITLSSGATYSAEQTSTVNFANNLNAYAADGEKTFTTTADVYDSLGGLHTVTLEFTKEETPAGNNTELNRWRWTLKDPMAYQKPNPTTKLEFTGQNLEENKTSSAVTTAFDKYGRELGIEYTINSVDGSLSVRQLPIATTAVKFNSNIEKQASGNRTFSVLDANGDTVTVDCSITSDDDSAELTISGTKIVLEFDSTGKLTSPSEQYVTIGDRKVKLDLSEVILNDDPTGLTGTNNGFAGAILPALPDLTFVSGVCTSSQSITVTDTNGDPQNISLDFRGLTVSSRSTLLEPKNDGNAHLVEQTGVLEFGSDGRLLLQNNNSIWFRPQVAKTIEWPTSVNVGTGFVEKYTGIDGEPHEIVVTYTQVEGSTDLYNWNAVDNGETISSGTYNKQEGTHIGGITYSSYGAANKMNLTLDFSEVTSSAGETTLAVSYRDGARNGSLKSYSIDFAGNIVGEFTNGMMRTIGQVALAKFANPAGLQKAGDTTFIESNNSGIAQLGKAGTVGFGSITPGSLEMSNVDLSQEFTDMIVTQRGLQANSRIITTSDEVLQEIVNLKR